MSDMRKGFLPAELLKMQLREVHRRMKIISAKACCDGQLKMIIEDALSVRGKMLRPALMLLCAGMNISDELLDTAAVIELTHTASLLHDDVVDDAPERRGAPTVQAKYGKCAAVYAGDYLLSGSLRYLMRKGFAESGEHIAACIEEMCDGEIRQLTNRGNTAVSEQEYMQAIEGKTASLFAAACHLGARLGNNGAQAVEEYASFGKETGIMFQLRDDLLDWTSCKENAGKPVNEDFKSGIYTLPAIYTFSSPQYGAVLRDLAELGYSADEKEIRTLVKCSGGIRYTEEELDTHREMALAYLSFLPETNPVAMLRELIIKI